MQYAYIHVFIMWNIILVEKLTIVNFFYRNISALSQQQHTY